MRLSSPALCLALLVASCGTREPAPCEECTLGRGAVSFKVALTSADVLRVVATVTGAGISTPLSTDLTIGGSPLTASGQILNVPVGPAQDVLLAAYPALAAGAEGGVVIYRGHTQVAVTAGQISSDSLVLYPVVADVAVTANFSAGDVDVARIDHISVLVGGNRIEAPKTFYLRLDKASNSATGTAQKLPVGAARTVTVTSFAADGTQLHQGAATTALPEAGTAVVVLLANLTGMGGISLDGGLCVPSCTNSVCGDDGCGGSCGGCRPDSLCSAGACSAACVWQPAAQYPLKAAPAGSSGKTGAIGGQGPGTIGGRAAWLQTSDWSFLFVPTGLADSDDVFAFESDFFIGTDLAAYPAHAVLSVFTSDVTTQCSGGSAQSKGGLLGLLSANTGASSSFAFYDESLVCQSTGPVTSSTLSASSAGAWHRLRIEGVRSTCKMRGLVDGTVASTWGGPCAGPLTGPSVALWGGASLGSLSATGWSNFSSFKGSSAACLN